MNPYNEALDVKRVALERFKFAVNHEIQKSEMGFGIDVEMMADHIGRRVVYQFRTDILGQKLSDIKYPKDWKEAFKERWFPKWALKKWPVKYTTIEMKALYPQIHIPKEIHRPVIHWMETVKPFEGGRM